MKSQGVRKVGPQKKEKERIKCKVASSSLSNTRSTRLREKKKKKNQNKKTPLSLSVLQHHQEPYSLNSIDFHRSVSIVIFYSIEFNSI
jgi:hypothetical protein